MAFLLSRRVTNCIARTLEICADSQSRFQVAACLPPVGATSVAIQRCLAGLRVRMEAAGVDQHFRTLKTFFSWYVESCLIGEHPVRIC